MLTTKPSVASKPCHRGAGRHQRLDPTGSGVLLERVPLGGLGLAGVRRHVMPSRPQVVGDLLGGCDREAVDDARARLLGEGWSASHARRCSGVREADHAESQRLAVERAPEHQDVAQRTRAAELLGDVLGDPGVRGGRGREHPGMPGGQVRRAACGSAGSRAGSRGPSRRCSAPRRPPRPAGGGQPGQHLVAGTPGC